MSGQTDLIEYLKKFKGEKTLDDIEMKDRTPEIYSNTDQSLMRWKPHSPSGPFLTLLPVEEKINKEKE